MRGFLTFAAALAVASPACAVVLPASPASIAAVLAKAQPGDTVQLLGAFGGVRLQGRSFSPPLVIDASAATLGPGWYWKDVAGVTFRGGTWQGLRIDGATRVRIEDAHVIGTLIPSSIGISINGGQDVVITRAVVSAVEFGVVVGNVDGLEVSASSFTGMMSDGIQLAGVTNSRIAGNVVVGTVPSAGAHPDCVQVRSLPLAITANLVVEDNVCTGDMQGLSFFNGPYRAVTLRNNQITVSFPQGIGGYDIAGLTLQGNRVRTIAGSPYGARINLPGTTLAVRSGNVVDAFAGAPAVVDPN